MVDATSRLPSATIDDLASLCEQYVRAGFSLVPLPPRAKGPTNKGWNLIENCISESSGIERIEHGVGLAHAYCSEPTCALDLDDMALATTWLAERGVNLEALLEAEDAVQILSGKPNRAKLLYRLPKGMSPKRTKVITKDGTTVLEFRCASGEGKTVQDVLPPSIHPTTGFPYMWGGRGAFSALPIIPDALLSLWSSAQVGEADDCSGLRAAGTAREYRNVVPFEKGWMGEFPETPENIARVKDALSCISSDCDYPEWIGVLFALKSTRWSCAETLARNWSMTCPGRWEKPSPSFEKFWNSAKVDGGITVGTLFYKAGLTPPTVASRAQLAGVGKVGSDLFSLSEGQMTIPTTRPPPRDYLLAQGVMRGTVAILAGLGGTAKTILAMQICIHGAVGRALGHLDVSSFSSVMFLGEEPQAERDRRFGALCEELSEADRQLVQKNVLCFPSAGKDLRLTWLEGNNPVSSGLDNRIIELVKQHEAFCGVPVGLIVLDHSRLMMAGDPNAAEDVTQLTRVLAEVAIATNAAVLLLAHSPKSVHTKEGEIDASEVAGSSAFVDNARCVFVLHTMRPAERKEYEVAESDRKKYVCLTTTKSNYGPTGTKWWFEKKSVDGWQTAKLVPVTLYQKSLFPNVSALTGRITDLVKQSRGRLTERKLRDKAGVAGPLKASEAEVMRTLGRMIEEGDIVKRPPTVEERQQHRLSPNVREVLDVA